MAVAHPFRDAAAAVVASAFETFGASARVTVGGGAGVVTLAIPDVRDVVSGAEWMGRTLQTGRAMALQRSVVAARPQAGDTIELLDAAGAVVETATILEAAQSTDRLGLVWLCPVNEPQL